MNVLFPQTSHSHTGLLVDGTSFHSHKLPFQTKAGCRFSPASRCKFSLCAEICAQESWHRTLTHHAHAHHHTGIGCVHSLVPLSLVVWSAVICFPWLTVYASEPVLSTPSCIKMHMHIIIPKQTAFMVLYPFLESLVGVVCLPWLTVYACEPILSTPFCIKLHISAFCIYPTRQMG